MQLTARSSKDQGAIPKICLPNPGTTPSFGLGCGIGHGIRQALYVLSSDSPPHRNSEGAENPVKVQWCDIPASKAP